MELLYMPRELTEEMEHLQEGIREDILILGCPIGFNSLEFMIYVKLSSLYIHMVFQKKKIKIPFIELSLENNGIELEKFLNGTYYQCDDLNSDIMLDVMEKYCFYCLGTIDSMRKFGWTKFGNMTFDKNYIETVTLDIHNSLFGIYGDYFDRMIENIQNNPYEAYDVYIYVNKKLGMFEKYCLSHEVDTELKATIHHYLGLLENVIGADNCVYSNQEYGHELVFIINQAERDSILSRYDLLFPVYAYNLKVLLDKAFSMYPIEKEEEE